jgi:hypothetical protein
MESYAETVSQEGPSVHERMMEAVRVVAGEYRSVMGFSKHEVLERGYEN